jgi:hypothetical protein
MNLQLASLSQKYQTKLFFHCHLTTQELNFIEFPFFLLNNHPPLQPICFDRLLKPHPLHILNRSEIGAIRLFIAKTIVTAWIPFFQQSVGILQLAISPSCDRQRYTFLYLELWLVGLSDRLWFFQLPNHWYHSIGWGIVQTFFICPCPRLFLEGIYLRLCGFLCSLRALSGS